MIFFNTLNANNNNIKINKAQNNSRPQIRTKFNTNPQQDSVSFSGAQKIITNTHDKAFIEILSKDLELTKESIKKLKDTVWNFLREKHAKSLSDFKGDDFFEEQVELQRKIVDKLGLNSDDVSELLSQEIVRRCDHGNDYVPGGLREVARGQKLQELGRKYGLRELGSSIMKSEADNKYYAYVKKTLRQTPMENYEFRAAIEDFMKENNMQSIEEFASLEKLNEHAALCDLLQKKFDLSEIERNTISMELLNRGYNDSHKYTPMGPLFAKDMPTLDYMIREGKYDKCYKNKYNFFSILYRSMEKDAMERNCETIFDIFKIEANETHTYKFLESSGLSKDKIYNIIMDIVKIAKNPEKYERFIPKTPASDNFYASGRNDIISDQIIKLFDLNKKCSSDIKIILSKMYPEHVIGGENRPIEQITYELADKYKLPANAQKELEKIINEVNELAEQDIDAYILSKVLSNLE